MKCVYLGGLAGSQSLVNFIVEQEECVLLYEARDDDIKNDGFRELEKKCRVFCIDALSNIPKNINFSSEKIIDEESIIRAVSSDSRIAQLKSRDKRIDLSGPFSTVCCSNDLIIRATKFYEHNGINEIYCAYSPHTFESFVFMRTMEECGVRVLKLMNSPLPWIFLPMEGLSNEPQAFVRSSEFKDLEAQKIKVNKYLSILKGEYDHAIPYYDRKPKFSFLQYFANLINSLAPKNLVRNIEKKIGYYEFKNTTDSLEKYPNFGVYFLHYQPESNTLPDAEIYNDQYLAIKKISDSLPDGVTLVLKEHPSTFAKRCDRRFRPRDFYRRLVSLPNVIMCPLDTPTFDLIDNALFVSSITGVCLTEALARGIPILFFNSARFSGFPSSVAIDGSQQNSKDLSNALRNILAPQFIFPHDAVIDSFVNLVTYGYDGSDKDVFILESVAQELKVTEKVNLSMMVDFFSESIRCSKM